MTDDFYIGYLPEAGPRLASHLRRTSVLLILVILGVGAALVSSMGGFSAAVFEYGIEREFEGVIRTSPAQELIVERPGRSSDAPATSSYLLVAFGKFGAGNEIGELHGHRVRLRGTLIYRDDQTMIEIAPGSVEDQGPAPALADTAEELGVQTLAGEIVDSKCFLGVMKPGNLKPHRACAVRCISGGVPPVLLVRNSKGLATYYFLVAADGRAVNADVLERVAEPLRIEGRVVRRAGRLFLYADPSTYEALD